MKIEKEEIINAAIDLFAEHGVKEVPIEMIAEKLKVTRPNVYHHFKKGKDEIIENILRLFDNIIIDTLKDIKKRKDSDTADSILSSLFLMFREEDSERGRKIGRIIFADHVYVDKIGKYLSEIFYKKRETFYVKVFNALISNGKLKPFDTGAAARILNGMFIAYTLQDSFSYPCANTDSSHLLNHIKNDYMFIINQIINGNFKK